MTATLVDTNIFLDVLKGDAWAQWSFEALAEARSRGRLLIIDVVYSELSVGFASREDLDAFLADAGPLVQPLSRPALFLAGKAFQTYRKRGGTRTGVLPDFFIGAHAAIEGLPLLTRDPRHYRTYFPDVELIAP
ncbi:type II toxin-antitoxin system VapC family toxin [Tianweitania sp. BSSL-BM11]|uniref:Type II toxin-antitoxin system VapC family toxin n=1 Tax=Tianweitania aestuarii TaxID=2814886 RepID=A0ABS5S1W8_9HYPH|nr:type II toxin-antitoxin system VapC family toxin [Tianweitania aestuarii]